MKRDSASVRFPRRVVALWLATFVLMALGVAVATAAPQSDSSELLSEAEQAMFVKGQTLHSQGLYSEAIIILNQFVELYPHSTIKDLGLLWLGRSYLAQGDIANAEKTALRLKAIGDTDMFGIYEEELRIGRQNYAKSVSTSHTRTNLAVSTNPSAAPVATIEVEKPKPATTATEVATGRDRKPVDATPMARPPANKSIEPVPAAPIVKGSPNTGLFLPSALEISTDQPGAGSSRPANTSSISRPLTDKTVVSSSPASTKAPVNVAATPALVPVAPIKKLVIEKTPATSLSAQKPAPTNNLIVAPQKVPVAALKAAPTIDIPLVRMKAEASAVRSTSDGTVSYRLVMTNEGGGVAKDLTVRAELDGSLEYVSSDLLPQRRELIARKQILTFRLPLVQPGETKVIQISVHPRGAVAVNIAAQTKHSIFYRDSQGNFLHTP